MKILMPQDKLMICEEIVVTNVPAVYSDKVKTAAMNIRYFCINNIVQTIDDAEELQDLPYILSKIITVLEYNGGFAGIVKNSYFKTDNILESCILFSDYEEDMLIRLAENLTEEESDALIGYCGTLSKIFDKWA